jgi:hypothetical protein
MKFGAKNCRQHSYTHHTRRFSPHEHEKYTIFSATKQIDSLHSRAEGSNLIRLSLQATQIMNTPLVLKKTYRYYTRCCLLRFNPCSMHVLTKNPLRQTKRAGRTYRLLQTLQSQEALSWRGSHFDYHKTLKAIILFVQLFVLKWLSPPCDVFHAA